MFDGVWDDPKLEPKSDINQPQNDFKVVNSKFDQLTP